MGVGHKVISDKYTVYNSGVVGGQDNRPFGFGTGWLGDRNGGLRRRDGLRIYHRGRRGRQTGAAVLHGEGIGTGRQFGEGGVGLVMDAIDAIGKPCAFGLGDGYGSGTHRTAGLNDVGYGRRGLRKDLNRDM